MRSLLARVSTYPTHTHQSIQFGNKLFILFKNAPARVSLNRPRLHARTDMSSFYIVTLLSSITVLSDSIHIGSMSPSRTIHFGPSWDKADSSLIVDEKRPKKHMQNIHMTNNTNFCVVLCCMCMYRMFTHAYRLSTLA